MVEPLSQGGIFCGALALTGCKDARIATRKTFQVNGLCLGSEAMKPNTPHARICHCIELSAAQTKNVIAESGV